MQDSMIVSSTPSQTQSESVSLFVKMENASGEAEWKHERARARRDISGAERGKGRDWLRLRPIEEADLPRLQEIHKFLFPVDYSDGFYSSLLRQSSYCLVAVSSSVERADSEQVRLSSPLLSAAAAAASCY